ncbi:hypothetical protein TNCV_372031 [Trichonephila clavipes]|nr:hypothetical protein TNCV_372031 [Trichonephila clavipes]
MRNSLLGVKSGEQGGCGKISNPHRFDSLAQLKECGRYSDFLRLLTVLSFYAKVDPTCYPSKTATAGSNVVQSGRPIFDDFFQHLWPYIGNNTANVVFQMVKRLWLIRIDQ